MQQEHLEKFRGWFGDYVASFYGDDEFINANLKLKEEHSLRTCEQMLYLSDELGLDRTQKRIAEVIVIFHDIGRFEQFVKYQTYNDHRSTNHCLLGLDVLCRTKLFNGINKKQKQLIEKAIEYHGLKELPTDLNGDYLLFSRLIRDADKLDIFYVVTTYYRQYRDNPEKFMLKLEFPDEPDYSAHVVEDVLCGRRTDYSRLRTLNDMKLLQLGWVYDVNFTATLKRIKESGFLDMIIDFLPATEEVENIRKKIFDYIEYEIKNEDKNSGIKI